MINTLALQERLAALGFYHGDLDGVRGPATSAAIIAFKKSQGLRARDYVGPVTLRHLFEADAAGGAGDVVPPWQQVALGRLGVREIEGDLSNPVILDWADEAGIDYAGDDVPWCGLFVASCLLEGLGADAGAMPSHVLTARKWRDYGRPCDPSVGSVMVFWRGERHGWRGHVGFYAGEDASAFHVLGGNQGNAVSIARIAKERLISCRWPHAFPYVQVRQTETADGDLSVDEA